MGVDEALVRKAVKARKEYILKNLEDVSLKSLRLTLEEDLGLQLGALKPYKELLSALIDRMLAKAKAAGEAAVSLAPAGKQEVEEEQPQESGEAEEEEEEQEEEEEEAPRKRRKQEDKPAKQSGARQYGLKVKKLQGICKAATIPIPPTIYSRNKGSEEALQQALEDLLEKHGLDASAGEREIGRVRARLQQQRDLDGIDTSNIIEGGRRRRGAAPVSYKALVDPASDEEEEEESAAAGSGSDEEASEGAAGSGSEGEEQEAKGAAQRGKPKVSPAAARKRKATAASSEDEESEEDEGAAADDSDAELASPAAAQAKSPDENHAARGNTASAGKAGKASSAHKAAAGKLKARPAASLEDSDSEGPAAQAGKGKRRAMADWSDDE